MLENKTTSEIPLKNLLVLSGYTPALQRNFASFENKNLGVFIIDNVGKAWKESDKRQFTHAVIDSQFLDYFTGETERLFINRLKKTRILLHGEIQKITLHGKQEDMKHFLSKINRNDIESIPKGSPNELRKKVTSMIEYTKHENFSKLENNVEMNPLSLEKNYSESESIPMTEDEVLFFENVEAIRKGHPEYYDSSKYFLLVTKNVSEHKLFSDFDSAENYALKILGIKENYVVHYIDDSWKR